MRQVTLPLVLCLLAAASPLSAATAAEYGAQGKAALLKREDQKAADLLAKAVELDPNNADLHYLLGGAYGRLALKANVLKQASLATKTKNALERAVQLDPGHTEARFALINYYLMAPGIVGGGAEKAYAMANELKKRDALDGHRAWARIYMHQKKSDLARKELVDAVREQPNSARAHYSLAGFYLNEKNWPASLHEYEMALKLDPAYMPTYFRLGQHAARSETNYARGEQMLRKYLDHKPEDYEPPHSATWYWIGFLQEKQGRRAEAKASYQKALAMAPGDKEIVDALKRVS